MYCHHILRKTGLMVLLTASVLVNSCAVQQDLIDRTENLALKKSLFTGEWFYQQTLIDVPGTETFTAPGMTNYVGTYRIRWDVQKDYLYARKSFEIVEGAKHIDPNSGEYQGAIVGAWRIDGHFDVKRSYNPTTGEENNVIEENTSDTKWFDAQYFRVDWSENLATDFMFLDADNMTKEGIPYNYEDEKDPRFKPTFDEENGYMDFVTAMAIEPAQGYFWGWHIPICWLFKYANAECNTEIIKIRNSFMKRAPNRDYLPRTHEGDYSEWFGFFIQDILKWESHYGVTQKTRRKYINRHNIWTKWHYEDSSCTTDADCNQGELSTPQEKSICDTRLPFFTKDIETDSDFDGLPDGFESEFGLDPNNADTNGDNITDQHGDKDGNGNPDLWDSYQWVTNNSVYRCTLPTHLRDPRPIAYFNPGDFPRSLVCDKDDNPSEAEYSKKPCNPWTWTNDQNTRNVKWSALHYVSNNYDEVWWRIFLMGGYGWSYEDYDKWITTKDISQFNADQQKTLALFGDSTHKYYAFTICPNNPVQDTDPWPCRFNHKSFSQAKALMEQGKDTPANRPIVRPGDIRFSMVHHYKDYYSGFGLLGLGPSNTDPVTGENLSGIANVYVLNDWAATYVQEMVQLLNGTISPEEYVNGVNLDNWVKAANAKSKADSSDNQRSYTPQDIKTIYDSLVQPWMKRVPRLGSPKDFMNEKNSDGSLLSNRQIKRRLIESLYRSGVFDPTKNGIDLDVIKDTPIEKQLLDEEVLMASGYPPTTPDQPELQINEEVLNNSSIARGGFITYLEARDQFKTYMSNKLSADFIEMADDAMVGLAYRLKDANTEEIWKQARDIIMRAVLTHEMGHTFGLHHNWGGSEDVVNFNPNYWRLRTNDFTDTAICNATTKTGLCPFFIKPINDYQLGRDAKNQQQGLKSMYEYAYSSVMDYAGRYTIDGNGLGRYDIAAMMYGHADKVEVFKDAVKMAPDNFNEWYDSQGSPLLLYNNRAQTFHYTTWYAAMGSKLYDESNRKLVNYLDIKPLVSNGRRDGYFYTEGNTMMPRVPYLFCSWTKGDISDGCNTRDYGSDQYERMKQHVDGWETWYPMRSFTRYQFGIDPSYYISRNYDRMYNRLKNFNDSYALYQGLFRQWYTDQQIGEFFTDPLGGWGAYTVAMQDAFNMALRTLAMPDIKSFDDISEAPDGKKYYQEAVFSSLFETDLTNGRYFTTSWNDTNYSRDFGLYWWEGLHHMGFYLDKVMTLFVLTDAQTYFVARDTAEDIRQWRISFFDNFSTQLIDFFGALLSEDYDAMGPIYDPSKPADQTVTDSKGIQWLNRMAQRNYAVPAMDVNTVSKPALGGPVEPATRFTLQIYSAVLGMLLFHQNFDNEFIQRSILWRQGNGQGFDIKPTYDKNGNQIIKGTITFEDPHDGSTFVGIDYKDGRGIAQKMLAHANKLKSRSSYCDNTNLITADNCASGIVDGSVAQNRANTALYEYRQLLDVVDKLTHYVQIWGNWSWNPFDP